jgi:tight adherence protein B
MESYLIAACACIFAFALVLSGYQLLFSKKIAAQHRIKRLFSDNGNVPARVLFKPLKMFRQKKPRENRRSLINLAEELSCAGIKLRVEEFMIIWAGVAFVPAVVCLAFGVDWLVPLALCAVGLVLPYLFIRRKKAKRILLLEDQLANALVIIGNCLKTGLSFQQALESIVREMPEPISKEFGRVVKEVQLGLTMETALENMANRLKSQDFILIVSAVLIQRQAGGNLSEILQNISDTIRERLKIKANLKVLTTTGRTSGKVVGLMPVFLMLVLMVINPSYIRMFFETQAGMIMLIVAGALEVIGYLAIKKVVRVKF